MERRNEIPSAAVGVRAARMMLNKGPSVVQTLQALDAILRRMAGRQSKQTAMLRPLGLARPLLRPRTAR